MKVNRQKLYHRGADFFALDGNAVMKLRREAAIEACLDAASQGLVAIKIEGGIWSDGTFEARMDAIWDGADPPVKRKDAHENNLAAANFIRSQDPSYNAFIITSYSFGGSSSAADRALAAR